MEINTENHSSEVELFEEMSIVEVEDRLAFVVASRCAGCGSGNGATASPLAPGGDGGTCPA
jgi:hypothetical protein